MINEIRKESENFPAALLAIGEDCPEVIFCMGDTSLMNRKNMVAIIGARAADPAGLETAYQLAVRYSSKGIISGLAYGIDTEAHWGCVDAEEKTIAVVGSGLDRIHPKENETLQQKILDTGGLIFSEQHLGIKASPRTLIARTRLQMALAGIVIIVECEKDSGTMHAVNFALHYNKRIYAVDNGWSGNRYLLDNGLVEHLPSEPEYMTLEEARKRLKANIRRLYRES